MMLDVLAKKIARGNSDSSDIDWSRTRAYAFGDFGQININLKGREPNGIVEPGDEYRRLRSQICEALRELKDPVTNEKIVAKICTNEQLYHGAYSWRGPDIFVFFKKLEYSTVMNSGFGHDVFGPPGNSGGHRTEGILLAKGKGIRRGMEIRNARIVDIAPTVLHIMGSDIPDDMDGRVLTDIFEPDSDLAKRSIRFRPTGETHDTKHLALSKNDEEQIESRLRQLGYLG